MLQVIAPQHRDLPDFFLLRSSWLDGSGRLSLGTRCITVVLPPGRPRADNVTFPWRNLPWYINLRISALDTASSSHSDGQLSKTNCAMSPALSLGLNKYSFVFPLTRINRKFILSEGTFLEPNTGIFVNFYYHGGSINSETSWLEYYSRSRMLTWSPLGLLSVRRHQSKNRLRHGRVNITTSQPTNRLQLPGTSRTLFSTAQKPGNLFDLL